MIRNEFFRRVITKCAASSLAWAAAERKFRSRGSFSKYSTRHGAQSISNSFLGTSSVDMSDRHEIRNHEHQSRDGISDLAWLFPTKSIGYGATAGRAETA